MKSKTLFKTLLVSLLCLTSLTSCFLMDFINAVLDNNSEGNTTSINSGNINGSVNGYKFDSAILQNSNKTIEEGKAGNNISILDYHSKSYSTKLFPSTGEQHLLVIPVYFKDYPVEQVTGVTEEVARANIYKAFFGDSLNSNTDQETGWESVKSYYSKASYGNLIITGMVTTWFQYNSTLANACKTGSKEPSLNVLRSASSWFYENYSDIAKDYDLNNDGYYDGIVLVYANPAYSGNESYYSSYNAQTREKLNDFLWAYVYWDSDAKANYLRPNASVYMFASYSFLWEGGYTKHTGIFSNEKLVDSHTFIHEFGHMMGLDDYYSYDSDGVQPLGRLDMMDYNIGDQNAFSKYLLGWSNPTLVTGEGTYTIKTSASYPEALVIPASLDDFSYSAFDEYIIIELYTPTVNNEMDSKNKYGGLNSATPYLYSRNGVKMLHVDSRLVVFNDLTKKYNFSQRVKISNFESISIGASNTASYSINPNFKLVSLISKRGVTNYFTGSIKSASDQDLFYKNEQLTGLDFDNGKSLDYVIKVDNIDPSMLEATITITKKVTESNSSNSSI